ncbi:MAG: HAD family hydrolase [Ruminococcaceae bacterium]|nr:HAD family hydrolase [Oscillospiraceae bacterium]
MRKTDILFDLDGTLTDPMTGITKSVRYALESYGIKVNALTELTGFIGPPLKASFQHYYGFSEEQATEAVEKYREYFSVTGLFENEVYPGIPELLKALSDRGCRLYVATSKPTVYAEQILRHFKLDTYFTFVGGSLLSGERVEKVDVLRYVLGENKIETEAAVMIGDRRFDIEGAKACGISSIGVLYGYGSREEMAVAGPDALAESVSDLGQILA